MKKNWLWMEFGSAVLGILMAAGASAVPTTHLQVRVVTGAEDLSAGSVLELRIYEAGKAARKIALAHGEAWPHDSTRIIALTLGEALDPGSVVRFGLYYRAANPLAPAWEVISADVDLAGGREPSEKLLNQTLSGVIAKQGELATLERDAGTLLCITDLDCDDHRNCNGHERCAPRSPGADARGCVKGLPVSCPVNQVCSEQHGCRGPDAMAPLAPAAAPVPAR